MTRSLRQRARRNGTASIYAGTEPRRDELAAREPKKKIRRRHRFLAPKRAMKRRRKDAANRLADATNYQARLAEPWPLYVKGGPT